MCCAWTRDNSFFSEPLRKHLRTSARNKKQRPVYQALVKTDNTIAAKDDQKEKKTSGAQGLESKAGAARKKEPPAEIHEGATEAVD